MRNVAAVLLAGLFFAGLARDGRAGENGPSPGQRLAVQTKPAVVRVVAGFLIDVDQGQGRSERRYLGGHGSGFFISPDGYLVTNAHVVEFVQQGEDKAHARIVADFVAQLAREKGVDLAKVPAAQRQEIDRAVGQAVRLAKKVSVIILPNGDQLVYDIKVFGTPVGLAGSKDVAILKVQTRNAPTLMLGDESTVEIQDKIYAIGYPGAADDLVGVLDEKAMLEATITDGNVSARKKTSDGVPVIQVTTVISPGNSGGPALNEGGQVVGLATFKAAQAEGYNFLVPASTVKEFLKQAGVTNEDSLTNQAFRSGLALHWEHRYTEAIKEFEEVRNLFPAHSEVGRLITEAQELKRQGKEVVPETSSNTTGILFGVVGGSALLAGLVYLLVRRGRHAPARAAPPGWHPGAHPGHPHAGYPNAGPPGPPVHAAHPGSGPAQHPVHAAHPGSGPAQHPAHAAHPGSGPAQHPGHAGAAMAQAAPGSGPQKTIAVSPNAGGAALAGLVCVRGLLRGQHFSLGAHGVVIGRQAGTAQVVIPDGRVSSKHVWIGFQDGVLMAIDQGSTNGTYVNDMGRGRITRTELRHGDTVIVSEPDVLTLNVLLQTGAGQEAAKR
jgi:S1-C subfamily serine protease